MLKTKEGQLNAVFACYGSAMQSGQLFEQALSGGNAVIVEAVVVIISIQLEVGFGNRVGERQADGVGFTAVGKNVIVAAIRNGDRVVAKAMTELHVPVGRGVAAGGDVVLLLPADRDVGSGVLDPRNRELSDRVAISAIETGPLR